MPDTQIDVPGKLLELVARFEDNRAEYKSPSYKEAQLRQEFLNPLFKALGWDVDNEQGYAEAYKDVVHEDALRTSRATKAPDYSFRIGGVRKFFLEAKKPAVNLREDAAAAYQLRRYGWSAKLPLSLLSNFAELHIYDCRVKPVQGDKASHSRVKSFVYTEFPERWAELKAFLSKTAVLKGAYDRFFEAKKIKKRYRRG
jgi:hypothetical protein